MFIAAGGFADKVGVGMGAKPFNELSVAFGIIGDAVGLAGQIDLQRGLGNIKADVEDRGVVLTHTCKNTSPGGQRPPYSSNGSSLGQRARAERATRAHYATRRMPGRNVSARTIPCPVATGQRIPSWQKTGLLPRRTFLKIQATVARLLPRH